MKLVPPGPGARHPAVRDAVDAVAMTAYLVAVAYGATLLGIPHAVIVAGAIAVLCLALLGGAGARRGLRADMGPSR